MCVQVRGGVVCPGISGRLQDSFPVETGFPLRSSLSRSLTLLLVHSLARSAQDQTPISVSWRREQTFTVDELSSSSNTSLKLSDFHEIKTLFLIMFFNHFCHSGSLNRNKIKDRRGVGSWELLLSSWLNNHRYR